MPMHGSRLQLDGSRLLTPGEHNSLDEFLRTSFVDLMATAHEVNTSLPCIATYLDDIETLQGMLMELEYCFDYTEDEHMFEEYKSDTHCSIHSSPEAEDALMERSEGYVFFFGGRYSIGDGGRSWAYKCELEDTLQKYEDRMRDYREYVEGLTTANI